MSQKTYKKQAFNTTTAIDRSFSVKNRNFQHTMFDDPQAALQLQIQQNAVNAQLKQPQARHFTNKTPSITNTNTQRVNDKQSLQELERLCELIRFEKSKAKICLVCKRKFASTEHLQNHVEKSQLHLSNLKKVKLS